MLFNITSRWKHIVFTIYLLLLCTMILKHEPWFDEAQAWLLARDSSPYDLFTKLLRYEGSPGLWHLLLILPAKLGLPYFALNILAGLIAAGSVFLFIWYSPFPIFIKVIYPFSYFALYQYAIIARSYVLLPLILFLTAVLYDQRFQRPFLFVLLLILLANTSLHGFIIAVGLIIINFFDFIRQLPKIRYVEKYRHLLAYTIFGLTALLLVLQLKPAPDLITVASFKRDMSNFFASTLCMLSDSLMTNIFVPVQGNEFFYTLSEALFTFIFILTLLWLILRKRLLLFIVPLAGLGALFTAVYANVWHQGTLFFLWLFSLWVSFKSSSSNDKFTGLTRQIMLLSIFSVLTIQVYWSFHSLSNDYQYNYSASKEAANYIKQNKLDQRKIYMTGFHTISILPYFHENIFCNYNDGKKPSFWLWSDKNNIYQEPYLHLSKYQPDIIIMGVKNPCKKRVKLDLSFLPEVSGYKVVKFFDGSIFWKERPYETDSFALFVKEIP